MRVTQCLFERWTRFYTSMFGCKYDYSEMCQYSLYIITPYSWLWLNVWLLTSSMNHVAVAFWTGNICFLVIVVILISCRFLLFFSNIFLQCGVGGLVGGGVWSYNVVINGFFEYSSYIEFLPLCPSIVLLLVVIYTRKRS